MRTPGQPARIFPRQVRAHNSDVIGVIAPGSPIDRDRLEAGCGVLHKLGYRTFYFDSIFDRDLYFAGTHRRRVWELEQMFQRQDIAAIVCARGGYGCNHLLSRLNLNVVRANPKIFVGYSDVTTLLTYFCDHADMVTYHGPMVTSDYAIAGDDFAASALIAATATSEFVIRAAPPGRQPRPGKASGVLYGGCLSMLAASLGTPYEIDCAGCILFVEDINTKPYQIDRMLMQLKLANKLNGVRGIVFGEMKDCQQPGGQDYTLQDAVMRVLHDIDVPVGFGLHSGHVTAQPNIMLPIGVAIDLEVSEKEIVLRYPQRNHGFNGSNGARQ